MVGTSLKWAQRHWYAPLAGVLVLATVIGVVVYRADPSATPATHDVSTVVAQVDASNLTRVSFRGVTYGGGGSLDLPAAPGAPTLLTATSSDGRDLSAIIIRFEGTDPVPVSVNDETTAFAYLVSAPPLLTADAGALLVVNALASDSGHFPDLVAALADGDEADAENARRAVAADVLTQAMALAKDAGADDLQSLTLPDLGGGGGKSAPQGATSGDGLVCPSDEPTADSGLCIAVANGQDSAANLVALDVTNRSRGWQAIVEAGDGGEVHSVVALAPPRRMAAMDGGTALATNYLKYIGTQVIDGLGDLAAGWADTMCGATAGRFLYGVVTAGPRLGSYLFSWAGIHGVATPTCDEFADALSSGVHKVTTLIVDQGIGRVDDAVWDPEGQTTAYVSADAPLVPTVAVTGAWGDSHSAFLSSEAEQSTNALLGLMNGWTNFVEPAWSLALGISARGDDSHDSAAPDEEKLSKNEYDALTGALFKSPALDDLLKIQASLKAGDLDAASVAAVQAWTTIALDPDLFRQVGEVIVGEAFSTLADGVKDAVREMVSKQLSRVGASVVVVTTAADLIFGVPAIAAQQHSYLEESRLVPASTDIPPLWWYAIRADHSKVLALNSKVMENVNLDQILIKNPNHLKWSGDFEGPVATDSWVHAYAWGPFQSFGSKDPDYGYPGDLDFDSVPGVAVVTDASPPWLGHMRPFVFGAMDSEPSVGRDGITTEVHPITAEPLRYAAKGDQPAGAWVIAAVKTDVYSVTPRWAICRFDVRAVELVPAVAGVYCSDTENYPDQYAYFMWGMAGSQLVEARGWSGLVSKDWQFKNAAVWASADQYSDSQESTYDFTGFDLQDNSGVLKWMPIDVPQVPVLAHWLPTDVGEDLSGDIDFG